MRISLERLRKRLKLGTLLIYFELKEEQLCELQFLNTKYNLGIAEGLFWDLNCSLGNTAVAITANKVIKALNYRRESMCSTKDRMSLFAEALRREHYLADQSFVILTLDSVKEICEQEGNNDFVAIKAGMLIEYKHGKIELIAESKDRSLYTVNPDTMNVSIDLRPFIDGNELFLTPELQIDKIYDIPSKPDNLFSTVNRSILYKAKDCVELTLDEAVAQLSHTLGKPVVIKGKPSEIKAFS